MDLYYIARAFMEKAAGYGSVLGLSSITELMRQLDDPQEELQIIHVAGTNGKGSTCAFLQNILKEAGYRVGTYTSPAVFSYEERFVIDGIPIAPDILCEYVLLIKKACDDMVSVGLPHPTLFEIETALAFLYFKNKDCDYVILEVGMGGETDATNVITHSLCSVFASIGRDHMQFLGNSLQDIAGIKSGIMKRGGCAVSIWQENEVEEILLQKANEMHVSLAIAKRKCVVIQQEVPLIFSYKEFDCVQVSMLGSYQLDNCVLALETVLSLREAGIFIPDLAVYDGIEKTIWKGRMEKISDAPLFYIDGAHNLPAANRLAETIEKSFTNKSITFIIGVLADKEHKEMMKRLLPYAKNVFTVTPSNPRRMSAEDLAQEIRACGCKAIACDSMEEAVTVSIAQENDMILGFGSLFYLQELKDCVLKWTKEHNDV